MKRLLLIVCFISCINFMTGCHEIQPSQPSNSSSLPSKTELPTSATPTELVVDGLISREFVNMLCPGYDASQFFQVARLPIDKLDTGTFRFLINDSSEDIFEVKIGWHNEFTDSVLVILEGSLIIKDGSRFILFKPNKDSIPIDDFQFEIFGSIFKFDEIIFDTDLVLLGAPVGITVTEDDVEGFGKIKVKTLNYDHIQIVLYQMAQTKDPNQWQLQMIISSDPAFVTPRGLKTGMDLKHVLELLGTGDLIISCNDLTEFSSLNLNKWDDKHGEFEWFEIELIFRKNILTSIKIYRIDP